MSTLIRIAEITGDQRYLEPLPRALDYLRTQCLLGDGSFSRFYELKSNKPLYMDQLYRLTYDDSNPPSHYGWKQKSRLDQIEKEFQRVLRGGTKATKFNRVSEEDVKEVLGGLGDDGSWSRRYSGEKLMGSPKFTMGMAYVSSAEFCDNVESLVDYLNGFPK
jgi:hypothetical protein